MKLYGRLFILLIFFTSYGYAKPVFHIGMNRDEVIKALPAYKSAFTGNDVTVRISGYVLHGMKGDAAFMFENNRLILFLWQYDVKNNGLTDAQRLQYSKLLRGLEKEWGEPYRTEAMSADPRLEKWYWRLPTSSGHTDYVSRQLKFTIADNDWLDAMRPKK